MSIITEVFQGGAEGIFSGVAKIIGTFKADPTEVAKLQAAIEQAKTDIAGKLIAADAAVEVAVNATMQEEAKSDHVLTWAWRPMIGMTAAAMIINNYVLMPYLAKVGLVPIIIPAEIWYFMTGVLGVTAIGRSVEKVMNGKV